jgi:hypothetical protein
VRVGSSSRTNRVSRCSGTNARCSRKIVAATIALNATARITASSGATDVRLPGDSTRIVTTQATTSTTALIATTRHNSGR